MNFKEYLDQKRESMTARAFDAWRSGFDVAFDIIDRVRKEFGEDWWMHCDFEMNALQGFFMNRRREVWQLCKDIAEQRVREVEEETGLEHENKEGLIEETTEKFCIEILTPPPHWTVFEECSNCGPVVLPKEGSECPWCEIRDTEKAKESGRYLQFALEQSILNLMMMASNERRFYQNVCMPLGITAEAKTDPNEKMSKELLDDLDKCLDEIWPSES